MRCRIRTDGGYGDEVRVGITIESGKTQGDETDEWKVDNFTWTSLFPGLQMTPDLW